MTHLREWLRRLIDEPTDISLDAMLQSHWPGAGRAETPSRDRIDVASLPTLHVCAPSDHEVANHASRA